MILRTSDDLKSAAPHKPEGVVDLAGDAAENHFSGGAAHRGEVRGHSGEATEDNFIKGELVV